VDYPKHHGSAIADFAQNHRIVVYTSNGCAKCVVLKQWLRTRNKEFEERSLEDVDVMTDLVMRNLVILSAPVLEVGDTVLTEDQIFVEGSLATERLTGVLEGK